MKKLAGIILIVLLAGCAQTRTTKYYLLDYVPVPTPDRLEQGPWPVSVRVRDFSIAEAYRRNQIVYRQSAHELRFYNYELWAVKPEYLVTDMMFKHIRDVRLFQELTRSVGAEEADYVLRGEITALEEYDNDAQWYAHLALSMQLQSSRNQTVVWARTWDYRKKVAQQEPVYVVRELSTLLEKIVDEAVLDLDSLMSQTYASAATVSPAEPTPLAPVKSLLLGPDQESERERGIDENATLPAPQELPPPEGY